MYLPMLLIASCVMASKRNAFLGMAGHVSCGWREGMAQWQH